MIKRALCMASNYEGTPSELAGCLNDANDWAAALTKRGFSVTLLLGKAATREAMLWHLRDQVARTRGAGRQGPGDLLVVPWSFHGSWMPDRNGDEPDRRDEVVVPDDYQANGVIVDDELRAIFGQAQRGARIVVIADSCHSGTVNRAFGTGPPRDPRARARFLPPAAILRPPALEAARFAVSLSDGRPPAGKTAAARVLDTDAVLLAAAAPAELAYDAWFTLPDGTERANGAFTRAALDALETLPPRSSYIAWLRAIRKQLPSADYPQTPELGASVWQRSAWKVLA